MAEQVNIRCRSCGRELMLLLCWKDGGELISAPPNVGDPLLTPVEDLELSARAYNCLVNLEVRTLAQLVQWTPKQLMGTKNMGKFTVREIEAMLAARSLSLKGDA